MVADGMVGKSHLVQGKCSEWNRFVGICGHADGAVPIAVSDLDGKDEHGVYAEKSRSKHYSGARGVIEYALMQARVAGNPVPEVRYNHVELPNVWKADVEIHHRPAFLCSPVRNHRLKRWVEDNEQFGLCADGIDKKTLTSSEVPSSPLAYNACDSACECDSLTASQASSAPLSGDDEAKEKKPSEKKRSFDRKKCC